MNWFRKHVKHGSRLALFALAIQFALSFGHFHGAAALAAAPAVQSGGVESGLSLATPDVASQSTPRPSPTNPDSDHHPSTDPCAICAVITMANAAMSATPPLLLLPQALEFLYVATDAEFVHLGTIRVVFQPRAPPLS